jgi:hypothetical protein
MMTALAWPEHAYSSRRNRYSVTPLLSACIVLRRLSPPCHLRNLELMFGKHGSQLSEIFWESIEHLLAQREHLIIGALHKDFVAANAARYAQAIHAKSYGLENCIGFIDGTVIGIARAGDAHM